jgi:hypothetical protein
MNELQGAIKDAVTAMLIKFNNRLSKNQMETESKLADWAEFLAFEKGFTVNQVKFALTQLTQTNKTFMPSAYEIADALSVKHESIDHKAPLIVLEILQAVKLFGQYDELKMIETLSEDARLTLSAIGGTSDIRNSDHDNIGTTKAQLERAVKGVLATKSNNIKNNNLERIGINVPGKILEFRTMDYSNFLPENEGSPA